MSERKSGTDRWQLVPDDEDQNIELWEWRPDGKDDLDELFHRIKSGDGTEEDHELFKACLLDRFIQRAFACEPLEPWISVALAESFYKVLSGGDWNTDLRLPGEKPPAIRPWREQRDLEIYCNVTNAVNLEGENKITDAIRHAADKAAVSYETARAAYYKWKAQLSKNS
ncbi:MAG TPA: hypothetical protein VK971_13155 [Thiohalobacter sp.]|nr:hypothetical protein [Thiohalobacter sp.]